MDEFAPAIVEHVGDRLVGLAAMPDGEGPFPAVLVMHNALGLGDHVRHTVRRLADLGYVAVASNMYPEGTPVGVPQVSGGAFEALMKNPLLLRERIAAWFAHVQAMRQVDAERVAAIGYCFGGTCVLELARSGAPVRAVASFHGILKTASPAAPGAVSGEVAAFCGARDPYAPLVDIEALRAEMASAGAHCTITTYSEAEHGFTDPASDAMGREGIAYNAMADVMSWAATVELLAATLA